MIAATIQIVAVPLQRYVPPVRNTLFYCLQYILSTHFQLGPINLANHAKLFKQTDSKLKA